MSPELIFALVCGFLALAYGMVSVKWILAKPAGTTRMQEIASAIQEGAQAYLNRQYTTIGIAGIVLLVVVGYFIGTNMRARNFDEVLAAIDLVTPELEVARTGLFLKESQRAWTMHLAGRKEEAREQALAALKRLENLARDLGYDYRFSMAKAQAFAVLGDIVNTREMVAEARATHPTDAVEEAVVRWDVTLSLAAAGLDQEAITLLGEHLSSPSYETVEIARIEPAFDGLRGNPAFQALLERLE